MELSLGEDMVRVDEARVPGWSGWRRTGPGSSWRYLKDFKDLKDSLTDFKDLMEATGRENVAMLAREAALDGNGPTVSTVYAVHSIAPSCRCAVEAPG